MNTYLRKLKNFNYYVTVRKAAPELHVFSDVVQGCGLQYKRYKRVAGGDQAGSHCLTLMATFVILAAAAVLLETAAAASVS